MDINYKIIWADDEIETSSTIKKAVQAVETYVKSKGLVSEIIRCSDYQELKQSVPKDVDTCDIDLLISDFNLASKEKGTHIISVIQQRKLFTETIFYGGNLEEMRDEILKSNKVYRISYYERDESLSDKVIEYIDWHLKKEFDVECLRGIVMTETSDIDYMMCNALESALNSVGSKEISDSLFKFMIKIIEEHQKITAGKITNIKEAKKPLEETMIKLLKKCLDSRKKSRSLDFLLNRMKAKNRHNSKEYSKLQDKRNDLGHKTRDEVQHLFKEYCDLLKELQQHKENINEINKEVYKSFHS